MLVMLTGAKEFAITEDEAKTLATAVANVAEHYNVNPDPKIAAWVNLFTVLAAMYGTRAFAYKIRRVAEVKAKAKAKADATAQEFGVVQNANSFAH